MCGDFALEEAILLKTLVKKFANLAAQGYFRKLFL
jgi:hypothetical protein